MNFVMKANVAFLFGLGFGSMALANGYDQAENLSQRLWQAKSRVDQMISAVGGQGGGSMPTDGGGFPEGTGSGDNSGGAPDVGGPWLVEPDVLEADAVALPIFIQSSSSLGSAASLSDQAKLAYLNANTQLGNVRFAQACAKMGIARSQIARANTAALQPPVQGLAAFGPDLRELVIELNNLKASEGCP